jgi:hypothetical protein
MNTLKKKFSHGEDCSGFLACGLVSCHGYPFSAWLISEKLKRSIFFLLCLSHSNEPIYSSVWPSNSHAEPKRPCTLLFAWLKKGSIYPRKIWILRLFSKEVQSNLKNLLPNYFFHGHDMCGRRINAL